MRVSPYFQQANVLLQRSPILTRHGLAPDGVEVWGSGADHRDLLQIKKPAWQLPASDGEPIGYQGVEVHYESCRPGYFVLHCEFYPRQSKVQKAKAGDYADLLDSRAESPTCCASAAAKRDGKRHSAPT